MALPFETAGVGRDGRGLKILAKTIYRELRAAGYEERDVVALAGELLGNVSREVSERRSVPPPGE